MQVGRELQPSDMSVYLPGCGHGYLPRKHGCCGRRQEQREPVFKNKTYITEMTSCFPRHDRESSATVIQTNKKIISTNKTFRISKGTF
jgi:uncharacterized OB-fold protein